MIDLKLIRENPEKVSEALLKRGEVIDLTDILHLDKQRREKITEVEGVKSRRNQVSIEISNWRRENKSTDQHIEEMKEVSAQIKIIDLKGAEIEN